MISRFEKRYFFKRMCGVVSLSLDPVFSREMQIDKAIKVLVDGVSMLH